MKSVVSLIVSIIVICSFLFLPSIQAVEKNLVKQEIFEVNLIQIIQKGINSFQSFLKRLLVFFELSFGVSIAILITQFFAIRVLPLILEIGFGTVVYVLVMLLLLTVPVQLLNGICLLIQKQLRLNSFQTLMLTIITFSLYIVGVILFKSSIPKKHVVL